MKSLKERIAIMQAYLNGKPVEYSQDGKNYKPLLSVSTPGAEPLFDWSVNDYRVVEDMELKAYNLHPHIRNGYHSLPTPAREWMRNIINAVKAGDIY